MPGSIVSYLVCLSLVPTLAGAGFATVLLGQTRAQRTAAVKIQDAFEQVATLDRLRLALVAGDGSTADALLRHLRTQPGTAGAARTLAARVQLLRGRTAVSSGPDPVDLPTGTRPPAPAADDLAAEVAGLEYRSSRDIATGRHGPAGSALLTATGQLTLVTSLVIAGDARSAALQAVRAAPADRRAALRAALRDSDAVYRSDARSLAAGLDGGLARRWAQTRSSSAFREFDGLLAELLAGRSVPPGAPITALRVAQATGGVQQQLSALLTVAVARGVDRAVADRLDADRHARDVALAAAAALLLAGLPVVLVTGAIRRRLHLLADSAVRLSAGRLEPVRIPGPREIELAGTALDDAARNLRRMLTGVEHLAVGDLGAAELQQPVAGPLGESVHAAFDQLTGAIRERERLQQELARQASRDALTGLPNRGASERILANALEGAASTDGGVAVLFIDLDLFKPVNDTYGHAAGDHVLQVVAQRMSAQLRGGDTVCRIGGDEFLAVLRPVAHEEIAAIGERLIAAISAPIAWDGFAVIVGASIGAAVSRPGETDADELLIRADHAVYRAKQNGRSTTIFA